MRRAAWPQARVVIGDVTFTVRVAATPRARAQGLQGVRSLCAQCGMLFLFPDRARHAFWMKDTPIALDILWINDGRVVDVRTAQPHDQTPIVPRAIAQAVLEVPAGAAARAGITPGATVRIFHGAQ